LFPGTHDPGTALSSVYAAVSQQIPFDGLQSNISQYDAGFLSVADLSDPAKVKMFQGAPVCGQFISYRGLYGSVHVTNKVWAASQISSPDGGPVTDVYINTRLANGLSQATVLHEALHNLTGAYDADLETLLGLSPPDLHDVPNPNTDCPIGSICISDLLQKKGCSGPN
jgi:hypothetical protein